MISQVPLLPSAVGAVIMFALAACQGPDTPVSAPDKPAAAPENGTVLFSENFSDAGSFQIVADPSGGFNSIVQAGIGSEAERLLAASSAQPTLAGVYRSLHGGVDEVPAAVAQASEHLEGRNPSDRGASPSIPLVKASSKSAFQSTLCHDFVEGSWKWVLSRYVWDGSRNFIRVEGVNSDGYYPDRVYAWNSTAWTATMSLASGSPFYPSPNSWKPTIAPYGVGWIQWGGTYSGAVAMMALPSGKYGELGLTDHYATPYVR
jgi:hypothetical protein